jgi:hypothetical protein
MEEKKKYENEQRQLAIQQKEFIKNQLNPKPNPNNKNKRKKENPKENPKGNKKNKNKMNLTISDDENEEDKDVDMVNDKKTIPSEILFYIDIIWDMVQNNVGTHIVSAHVSTQSVLRDLFRNENRLIPQLISVTEMNNIYYWDQIFHQVNLSNLPMAFTLPGKVVNPYDQFTPIQLSQMLKNTNNSTLLNDTKTIVSSVWLPRNYPQFHCPIPCITSLKMNHIKRTQNFTSQGTQIIIHEPRVCRGHKDYGFGWLYLVEGFKIFLYVEDPKRPPGTALTPKTQPVPGCSVTDSWDLDILSKETRVKYFIMLPGNIVFVPPSLRHIVISPIKGRAYGEFCSHVYGAISDLCSQLNVQRERHEDISTDKNDMNGQTEHQSTLLIHQIIKFLDDGDHKGVWDKKRLKEIVESKAENLISTNRALRVQLDALVCKIGEICK